MSKDDKSHPSYATIRWGHQQSSGNDPLFMSSLGHRNTVYVEVSEAVEYLDRVPRAIAKDLIIQLQMSPLQWAEFISTPNQGTGTPCTIQRRGAELVPRPPRNEETARLRQKVRNKAGEVSEGGKNLLKEMDAIIGGKSVRKKDLRELRDKFSQLLLQINDRLPFVVQEFQEHMDDLTHDAVASVNSQIQHKIRETGLAALGVQIDAPALPEE